MAIKIRIMDSTTDLVVAHAHPFGSLLGVEPLVAADGGDDGSEHGSLDQATDDVPGFNEAPDAFQEHVGTDAA